MKIAGFVLGMIYVGGIGFWVACRIDALFSNSGGAKRGKGRMRFQQEKES